MFRPFQVVKADPGTDLAVRQTLKWVEHNVCRTVRAQNVVGRRYDRTGRLVTDAMFVASDRDAHMCPFVQDSIDQQLIWIGESHLDETERAQIESLLFQQAKLFMQLPPPFIPAPKHMPTGPVAVKTAITVFPGVACPPDGEPHLLQVIHDAVKSDFRRSGLMLGQFYPGCTLPALYQPSSFKPLAFKWPVFAIRYMHKQDDQFLTGSPDEATYHQFF